MKWLTLFLLSSITLLAQPKQDDLNIEISRRISVDLLGPNADPFMQPLTQTLNATANSRFFRTAHIPDTGFYCRIGVGSMLGFVRDDQKNYKPVAPTITSDMFIKRVLNDKDLIEVNLLEPSKSVIRDTTGLVVVIMKYLFEKGLTDPNSGFSFPDSAATVYGNRDEKFVIGKVTQKSVRRERMGHIMLAVPVVHIWFLRSLPSKISHALGMVTKDVERIVYYESYVVVQPGSTGLQQKDLLTEEQYLEVMVNTLQDEESELVMIP